MDGQTTALTTSLTLNNGKKIPVLGLGVYKIPPGRETEQAVSWALEAGYRHIDTASLYGNEASVGKAIRESGISREEIFVTTKLWPTNFFRVEYAFMKSLDALGIGYVDLYLIHWPFPGKDRAWKRLELLYKHGNTKAIGVSNYTVAHLEALLHVASDIPMVNQVEFSPFLYQKELLEFCVEKKIVVEAFSPLTRGRRLNNPTIANVARAYGKTTAQMLIRWAIQHGLVVLPKSSKKERIFENAQVFDFVIGADDMARLDALDEGYRTTVF